jgi:hypothetical protein
MNMNRIWTSTSPNGSVILHVNIEEFPSIPKHQSYDHPWWICVGFRKYDISRLLDKVEDENSND